MAPMRLAALGLTAVRLQCAQIVYAPAPWCASVLDQHPESLRCSTVFAVVDLETRGGACAERADRGRRPNRGFVRGYLSKRSISCLSMSGPAAPASEPTRGFPPSGSTIMCCRCSSSCGGSVAILGFCHGRAEPPVSGRASLCGSLPTRLSVGGSAFAARAAAARASRRAAPCSCDYSNSRRLVLLMLPSAAGRTVSRDADGRRRLLNRFSLGSGFWVLLRRPPDWAGLDGLQRARAVIIVHGYCCRIASRPSS